MATQTTYERERATEQRANCETCGTSDARCTRLIFNKGRACCTECARTEQHPPMPPTAVSHPCPHCHGSGIARGAER